MLLLNIEFLDLYYLINILCIIYSFGEISMHHLFMHQQIHWLVSFWIHSTQMCDPTDVFFLSKQGILPMFLEIWFLLKPINSLLPFENKNTYQCWIHISTCKKKKIYIFISHLVFPGPHPAFFTYISVRSLSTLESVASDLIKFSIKSFSMSKKMLKETLCFFFKKKKYFFTSSLLNVKGNILLWYEYSSCFDESQYPFMTAKHLQHSVANWEIHKGSIYQYANLSANWYMPAHI